MTTRKIYVLEETAIPWGDTATNVMTLNNLAASGGARIGGRKDLGAAARSEWYNWRFTTQFETAPVVAEVIDIYLAWSDGTNEDGQLGTADAAGAEEAGRNMKLIGHLIVTSVDAAHDMTASGIARIPTRYVSPMIVNNTADNLKATNDTSLFVLTPMPPQVQSET